MKKYCFLYLFVVLFSSLFGQTADQLLLEADSLLGENRGIQALRLLADSLENYPESEALYLRLGSLYSDAGKYGQALQLYQKGLDLLPDSEKLLYQSGIVLGLLGKQKAALQVYESLAAAYPDSVLYVKEYAWTLLKLYRSDEAEQILLKGLDHFGNNLQLQVTLGSIYFMLDDYDSAKQFYLQAAENENNGPFNRSVAWYNISLLEKSFFKYSDAFSAADMSIKLSGQRASGYRSRGDLYIQMLDFQHAAEDYQKAIELDNSPLSLLGMARVLYYDADLDGAESYIMKALNYPDSSWMNRYGVDTIQFRQSLNDLLSDIYKARNAAAKKQKADSLKDWFAKIKSICSSGLKHWYYSTTASLLSWKIGRRQTEGGELRNSLASFAHSMEGSFVSEQKFLELYADSLLQAGSQAAHFAALVRAGDSIEKLKLVFPLFTGPYERLQRSNILVSLARSSKGKEQEGYLNQLRALYPKAIILNGW